MPSAPNSMNKLFPDMRKTLNELQKFASQGVLEDVSILKDMSVDQSEFFKILAKKNFNDVKKFVSSTNSDPQTFYSNVFDVCSKFVELKDLPEFILLLNKYCVESTMVADARINLLAFSTDAMMNIGIKDESI
jgi:replication factor C small subunit